MARATSALLLDSAIESARLGLRHNEIGDAGAAAIAEALKVNGTLRTLLLADNQIGAAGAAAIAEAALKALRTLFLFNNNLNEDSKSKLRDVAATRFWPPLTIEL